MKFKSTISTLLFLIFQTAHATHPFEKLPTNSITALSELQSIKQRMVKADRKCEPYINELDVVKVRYYGFDEKLHNGILLIHHELSKDVLDIFKILYKKKFPIEKMYPIHNHHNVTVSYNCREVAMQRGRRSQHSYGRAIDINPLQNPYVKGKTVIPAGAQPYINRELKLKGQINRQSLVYQLFIERGWDWGGNWYDVADYQHFEKRANGEKRNPYGYD